MDKWHPYTQGDKSIKEYVAKFDEFLIKCRTFSKEGQAQILYRFRARLREDLRTKLIVRGITESDKADTIVQDLDSLRSNYNTRSFDSKLSVFRTSASSQFNKSSTQSFFQKNDFKGKRCDDRSKTPEQTSSIFSTSIKCYRCQGYSHITANCSSEMKITFTDGVLIAARESDVTIPLVAPHVVTEFSDVPNESQAKPPPICDT